MRMAVEVTEDELRELARVRVARTFLMASLPPLGVLFMAHLGILTPKPHLRLAFYGLLWTQFSVLFGLFCWQVRKSAIRLGFKWRKSANAPAAPAHDPAGGNAGSPPAKDGGAQ